MFSRVKPLELFTQIQKKKKNSRVNKNADTTYPPPPTLSPRCLPSGRVGNLMIWKITISNVLARPLPPLNAP